jgi:hypothetical protein
VAGMGDDSEAVSRLFYVLAIGLFSVFAIELLRFGFDFPTLVQGIAGVIFAMAGTWFDRQSAQQSE